MAGGLQLSSKAGAEFLAGAVRRENLDAMHKLLFEDKVDPNSKKDGATMLHIAAEMGNDRAITMLLEAGADVHLLNAQRESVLRKAIKIGDEVSVKKLLEAGQILPLPRSRASGTRT